MKNLLNFTWIILIFSACGSQNSKDVSSADVESGDGEKVFSSKVCYLGLEGNTKQDSSFLNLQFIGNQVTGTFNHIPKEKDSRKGTIKGEKKDAIIRGIWTFMQEGVNDTLAVEFKVSGEALYQKEFVVDPETGRQKLSDSSPFSLQYVKVPCKTDLN